MLQQQKDIKQHQRRIKTEANHDLERKEIYTSHAITAKPRHNEMTQEVKRVTYPPVVNNGYWANPRIAT